MFKVFISLPMKGVSDNLIKARIFYLDQLIKEKSDLSLFGIPNDEIVTVDNFRDVDIPSDVNPDYHGMFMVGTALERMASCDAVFFAPDYFHSNGCMVEYEAAKRYGMPICKDYYSGSKITFKPVMKNKAWDIRVKEWYNTRGRKSE